MKKPVSKELAGVLAVVLLGLAAVATSVVVLFSRLTGAGGGAERAGATEPEITTTGASTAAALEGRTSLGFGMREYEDFKREHEANAADYTAAFWEYQAAINNAKRTRAGYNTAQSAAAASRSAIRIAQAALDSGDQQRIRNAASILSLYYPNVSGNATAEELRVAVLSAESDMKEKDAALAQTADELEAGDKELEDIRLKLELWQAELKVIENQMREMQSALGIE